jgi:acetyl esterase/lipase
MLDGGDPRRRVGVRRTVAAGMVLGSLAFAPAASAWVRQDAKVFYGAASTEFADVYQPAPMPTGAAVVVLVHGGGWRSQTNNNTAAGIEKEAKQMAAHGALVFDIDYPQDSETEAAFPLEVRAVQLAAEYAARHASGYGANGSKVILVGGSAGGQLVERVAERVPTVISKVIALSGPSDFVKLKAEEAKLSSAFRLSVNRALGCELAAGCPLAWQRAWSPVDSIAAGPSWLLFTSAEDKTVPPTQTYEMGEALTAASDRVRVVTVPGGQHSFGYWEAISGEVFAEL